MTVRWPSARLKWRCYVRSEVLSLGVGVGVLTACRNEHEEERDDDVQVSIPDHVQTVDLCSGQQTVSHVSKLYQRKAQTHNEAIANNRLRDVHNIFCDPKSFANVQEESIRSACLSIAKVDEASDSPMHVDRHMLHRNQFRQKRTHILGGDVYVRQWRERT